MSEETPPGPPDLLGSITMLVRRAAEGDSNAQTDLFERVVARLEQRAGRKLQRSRCTEEPEDAAQIVMHSVFRRLGEGKFTIDSRNNLWALLFTIMDRKCIGINSRNFAKKRGGDHQIVGEAVLAKNDSGIGGLDRLDSAAATPEDIVRCEETIDGYFDKLEKHGDQTVTEVVAMRLEGYSNQEISERIGRGLATVERKFKLARDILSELLEVEE